MPQLSAMPFQRETPPTKRQEERVKLNMAGKRLDQALAYFAAISRSEATALIESGVVFLDGQAIRRPSMRVTRGMLISWPLGTVAKSKNTSSKSQNGSEEALPIVTLLAETEDFLVLNKPAGLAMHPVRKNQKNTLTDWLYTHYPQLIGVGEVAERPGMVHRLDKDTSGIVLIAKHDRSFVALKKLFQDRNIKKRYLALVYGNMKSPAGTIDTPLGRVKGSIRRGSPIGGRSFGGVLRPAVTEYSLHTRYPQYDLLSVEPKTGRTHQIRVHLASLGHPVVGDRLYRFKEHRMSSLTPPHQLLHAESLHFTLFGKKFRYEAPLPGYYRDSLSILNLSKAEGLTARK